MGLHARKVVTCKHEGSILLFDSVKEMEGHRSYHDRHTCQTSGCGLRLAPVMNSQYTQQNDQKGKRKQTSSNQEHDVGVQRLRVPDTSPEPLMGFLGILSSVTHIAPEMHEAFKSGDLILGTQRWRLRVRRSASLGLGVGVADTPFGDCPGFKLVVGKAFDADMLSGRTCWSLSGAGHLSASGDIPVIEEGSSR